MIITKTVAKEFNQLLDHVYKLEIEFKVAHRGSYDFWIFDNSKDECWFSLTFSQYIVKNELDEEDLDSLNEYFYNP